MIKLRKSKKRYIFTQLLIIVIFFMSVLIVECFADGCFMSEDEQLLYFSDQKAAITWDGTTQQMIIASALKKDDLSNMVWVLPIESKIKPIVEKSDIELFNILGHELRDKSKINVKKQDNVLQVEVVEAKEIDIYDLTILKVSSSEVLLDWLNKNKFIVNSSYINIFDEYVKRKNMYFVINKLDLSNKFNDEIKLIDNIFKEMEIKINVLQDEINLLKTEFINIFGDDLKEVVFENGTRLTINASNKIIEFILGRLKSAGNHITVLTLEENFENVFSFLIDKEWKVSIPDYEQINNSYIMIKYKNRTVLEYDMRSKEMKQLSVIQEIDNQIIEQKAQEYLTIIKDSIDHSLEIANKQNYIIEADMFETVSKSDRFLKDIEEMLCGYSYYDRNSLEYEIFANIVNNMDVNNYRIPDYCKTVSKLRTGLATPLKISFQPSTPYYPLIISRLGNGQTNVLVYVFSGRNMKDVNNAIKDVKYYSLDSNLIDKLNDLLNIDQFKTISRFTWSGKLKELKSDLEFVEK